MLETGGHTTRRQPTHHSAKSRASGRPRPLNPAASTTAGQFAASMLVSRAASRSGLAPATGLVAATGVVPAGGPVRATGLVRETEVVPATDGVLAMLTG